MKKLLLLFLPALLLAFLAGCHALQPQIAATTLPVYEFTTMLCEGTGITVGRVVTENVSCLHDYTLQVQQMRMLEAAEAVVISGAGLEDFLEDALLSAGSIIDASAGTHIHTQHGHDDHGHTDHAHETDPHIWLSPENAKHMAVNIKNGLSAHYPQHAAIFDANLKTLTDKLDALQAYGDQELSSLSCRNMITFHNGFAYFAESFDLTILRSVEEESGSEASAAELKELLELVRSHQLPAVFIEVNGSASAANVISAEYGTGVYALDMAISGNSYFDAMYHNINTVKEALE